VGRKVSDELDIHLSSTPLSEMRLDFPENELDLSPLTPTPPKNYLLCQQIIQEEILSLVFETIDSATVKELEI